MKIRPVGAELFHEDGKMVGRMDIKGRHDEAKSRFSQFYEGA